MHGAVESTATCGRVGRAQSSHMNFYMKSSCMFPHAYSRYLLIIGVAVVAAAVVVVALVIVVVCC